MRRPGRAGGPGLLKLVELVLFPSFCRRCGKLLDRRGEKVVCRECWAEARPRRSASLCPVCGLFLEGAGRPHPCRECAAAPPAFSVHRSCGEYGGALKDIILLFKYRRLAVLGRGLAGLAREAVGGDEALWQGADALVPVPLHPRRRRDRGFNQSRVFADELARLRDIRVLDGVLVKVRNAPPQTALEGRERAANVRGAYAVRAREKAEGKVLILIDDVYTTGSTMGECARTLLEAGAREVRAMTIARA